MGILSIVLHVMPPTPLKHTRVFLPIFTKFIVAVMLLLKATTCPCTQAKIFGAESHSIAIASKPI